MLSGDRWYRAEPTLARSVEDFFSNVHRFEMPEAEEDENESVYNERVANSSQTLVCLDRKLVKPSGALSEIEACDFLSSDRLLIHIKGQTRSSCLSHLFNQGTVSARVLKTDGAFRDKLREIIGSNDCENLIPGASEAFIPNNFTVGYAVLTSSRTPKLPFFSLVTFRQAAHELEALGFKTAFAWISKPVSTSIGKTKAERKSGTNVAHIASTSAPSPMVEHATAV